MTRRTSGLPVPTPPAGVKVHAVLKNCFTDSIQEATLISVDDSDCDWRFPEDNAELSHDWDVVFWQEVNK